MEEQQQKSKFWLVIAIIVASLAMVTVLTVVMWSIYSFTTSALKNANKVVDDVVIEDVVLEDLITEEVIIEEVIIEDEDLSVLIPEDAVLISFEEVDLEGDGIPEQLFVYYTDGSYGAIAHVEVYQNLDGEWDRIKEDKINANNYSRYLKQVEVIDLENGQQGVFVHKLLDEPDVSDRYYVFGFSNGGFRDFSIQRGYLHEDLYLEGYGDDCSLLFNGPIISSSQIEEDYVVMCDYEPQSYFTLVQEFKDGIFIDPVKITHEVYQIEGVEMSDNIIYIDKYDKNIDIDLGANFGGDYAMHDVLSVVEYGDKLFVYITMMRECGGCVNFMDQYVVVDLEKSEYSFEPVPGFEEEPGLSEGWCLGETVMSPDGKHIVGPCGMYDFVEQKSLAFPFPEDGYEGVELKVGSGQCHGLCDRDIYWRNNDEFVYRLFNNEYQFLETIVVDLGK